MNLEENLRSFGPALDRAIDEAAIDVTLPAVSVVGRDGWSRRSRLVLTLAAVAAIAVIVGVMLRVDTGGRHGVATTDAPTIASTTSSTATTTSTARTTSTTVQPSVPLQSVRWATVDYPMTLHCGNTFDPPVKVGSVEYTSPAAGVQLAVVLARCNAGAGSPTASVYVFDRAATAASPHLLQTLIVDTDGWLANVANIEGATISLPVRGYSSASVAHCCPDVEATLVWNWTGSQYELVSTVPPHATR